jgi:hypothetical protein
MLCELRAATGDADSTGAASTGGSSWAGIGGALAATGGISPTAGGSGRGRGFGHGLVPCAGTGGFSSGAGAIGVLGAPAGASTSPASAVSTVAATGSQTGHSRIVGAISRPHSGQIQWNMPLIYTHPLFIPFRRLPYPAPRGTLTALRFRLREMSGDSATRSPAHDLTPREKQCRQRDPQYRCVQQIAVNHLGDRAPLFPNHVAQG